MGNTESEKKSDEQLQIYLSSLNHVRKEHSLSLGRDIDLYSKINPQFPEELILLYEATFDEDEESPEDRVERFKREINLRKKFSSLYISQLLFVNYKILDGMCINKVQCRISLQYSEFSLARYINETKVLRTSQIKFQQITPDQIKNFLEHMTDALLCLRENKKSHGFIKPDNILMYNKDSKKPIFKLFDVSLLCGLENSFQRMMQENDYFAPLDPDMMSAYSSHNSNVQFYESHDIWALGITTLCYIFSEDFNVFYDWNQKKVNLAKIDSFLKMLNNVGYNQKIVRIVSSMLEPQEYTRVTADQLYNEVTGIF
jgi:serine/threonine protein kinase